MFACVFTSIYISLYGMLCQFLFQVSSAVPSRRSRAMTSPVHAITMATTAISSSVAVEPLQLNSLLLSDDPVDQVSVALSIRILKYLESNICSAFCLMLRRQWNAVFVPSTQVVCSVDILLLKIQR